jgi:hypothetical protein
MAKDTEPVRVNCPSCGAGYTVQVSWLEGATEFDCSCGARLKADSDDLFQLQHNMKTPAEITLHPFDPQPDTTEVAEHATIEP